MQKEAKAKRGRPSLPPEDRKLRGITRYIKGQVVLGKEILGFSVMTDVNGRRIKYLQFTCDCRRRFNTTEARVTKAVKERSFLRCRSCAVAGRLDQNSRKIERGGSAPETSERASSADSVLSLLPVTLALIRKTQKDPDLFADVKRIMASHLRRAIEPINLDQAWKEAVEVAKLNRKTGGVCGEWTRANVGEGLQRQSYTQYL